MTEEQQERLKQIQRWRINYVSANRDAYVDLSWAFSEIDFLLSLLDSQAATRPVGWISCGLRHGHDRIVDILFENADCAKAFIDGVEPVTGPIVAATAMRDACVEKVNALAEDYSDAWARQALKDAAREINSITLDQVGQKKHG